MTEEQVDVFTFGLNTMVNDSGKPEGNGGQGEIYLHPDPIDLEIADFRFEFERWVKNNTSSSDPQINNNSTGEVAP